MRVDPASHATGGGLNRARADRDAKKNSSEMHATNRQDKQNSLVAFALKGRDNVSQRLEACEKDRGKNHAK
jgi:hypothetical protein